MASGFAVLECADARWVTGARPDQEGRFRIRTLPPGSYNVVAVDYIETGAWGDPELLERLKARARRITLVPWKRDDLHKSRSAAPRWQGAKSELIGHK